MKLRPTVGLALIVYNEAPDLPNLLESVQGAFDQIVLVDNANPGSDDGTVDVFRDWCASTGQEHVIDSFEWNDNASAKRTHADGLLNTDWKCWADCDDTIIGAHNLRELAAEAPAELAGYGFDYDYIARWVHRPPTAAEYQASEERDRRIFQEWALEEPDHPWVITHQHHEAVRQLIDAQDAMSEAVEAVATTAARAHLLLGRR